MQYFIGWCPSKHGWLLYVKFETPFILVIQEVADHINWKTNDNQYHDDYSSNQIRRHLGFIITCFRHFLKNSPGGYFRIIKIIVVIIINQLLIISLRKVNLEERHAELRIRYHYHDDETIPFKGVQCLLQLLLDHVWFELVHNYSY